MFRKAKPAPTGVVRPTRAVFETLEDRRMLSASILRPAAVEGSYKGEVLEANGTTTVPVKVIVTSTEAELIIDGSARLKASLSSAHLISIRKGTFDVKFVLGSESVTLTGKETGAGARISGSYSTSTSKTGTFVLKK